MVPKCPVKYAVSNDSKLLTESKNVNLLYLVENKLKRVMVKVKQWNIFGNSFFRVYFVSIKI